MSDFDKGFDQFFNANAATGGTPAAKTFDAGFDEYFNAKAAEEGKLRTSVFTAGQTSPEKAAVQQRLAKVTGLPLPVVQSNEGEAQARAKFMEISKLAESSPVLRARLMDPDFTAIAQDDTPALESLGNALVSTAKYIVSAPGTKRGLAGDAVDAGKAIGLGATVGVGKTAFDGAAVVNDLIGWENGARSARAQAKRAQEAMDYFGPEAETATGKAVVSGLQSAGQNLAFLPIGLERAAVGNVNAAANWVAGILGFGVGADAYNDKREAGGSQLQALLYGIPQGTFEFAFEKIPAAKLFGDLQASKTMFKTLVGQMGTEIPTEQVTTLFQDFNTWMSMNPEKSLSEFIAERPGAAYQTLIATMVGVGVQTGAIKALDSHVNARANEITRQEQAAQATEHLQQLMTLAAQSKLRERSPETFAEVAQQIAEQNGAPTDVRFDARTLSQVLNQEEIDALPGLAPQMAEAVATGGEVSLPLGTLMSTVAGTPLEQKLTEHARLGDAELSAFEAKEANAQAEVFLQEQAARVIAEANDNGATQASADSVRTILMDQLEKLGRFTSDVNGAYATVATNMYVALSSRLGITPQQAFEKYGMTIDGVNPATQGEVLNATRPGALNLEGYHYSKQARPVVSTAMYGTGLQGSNADVYKNAEDKRLRSRAYFYVDTGNGITPEAGVGGIGHRVNLSNIYDANSDPLRLRKGGQLAFESAVLDRGFSGYLDRLGGTQPGQVVLLGDQNVNTEILGPMAFTTGKVAPAQVARESLGRDAIVDQVNANTSLPAGSPTLARWSQILEATMPAAHKAMADAGVFETDTGQNLYKSELVALFESMTDAPVYGQKTPREGISAFDRWAKGAPLVRLGEAHEFKSGEAVVVEALHGTTNTSLTEFSRERANVESDFGAGFYASNSAEDVAKNYASNEGPDLTNKIERLAEQLEQDDAFEGDHDYAVRLARAQLSESAPNTLKLYLRFANPVVIGGKNETLLDYSEPYDEETDTFEEPTGVLIDFVEALRDIAPDYNVSSKEIESAIARIFEEAEGDSLKASSAVRIIKNDLVDASDDTGSSAAAEVARLALERVGFDGIIDTTVAKKFKNMEGLTPESVHFIAFEPTQIKSATGNSGGYDPADANILKQSDQNATNVGDVYAQGTGTGWDSPGGFTPLPGAPKVEGASGPDPRLIAVAEQYAASLGIPLKRQSDYVKVDPVRAAAIAEAYDTMQHAPQDPAVKEAYANLIQQTVAQYRALEAAGYKFYFFDETNDPYQGNPWNAMRDLRANQRMGVFATESGFGSGATELNVDDNPLLADTGIQWPYGGERGATMKRVLANDLFRAVHDAFGHGLEGAGFRAEGEENAWQAHVRLFTGSAVAAITSETRGQNSWLNYGPHGEANRNAKVEDTVFADQKTGLMPAWTWEEGRAGDALDTPTNTAPTFSVRQTPVGFEAVDVSGKVIGRLESNITPEQSKQINEPASVDIVKVDDSNKGRGVGSALYAAWNEAHEGRITPSGKTSLDAWKLWKRNYPAKVQEFVQQEAMRIAGGAPESQVLGNITDPEVKQAVVDAVPNKYQAKYAAGRNPALLNQEEKAQYSALATDQTQTPEFKAWFGDSKVVDAQGNPLVVMHASTYGDITQFDKKEQRFGKAGYGFYFSDAAGSNLFAEYGNRFQSSKSAAGEDKAVKTYPVYLSLQNPLVIDHVDDLKPYLDKNQKFGVARGVFGNLSPESITQLQRQGYDGIITRETTAPKVHKTQGLKILDRNDPKATSFPVYVAFEPTQIKSAIGNSGAFSLNDPNILNQPKGSTARGTFNPKTLTISLLERADLSTFHHEMAHFYLEVLVDVASQPGAPASITGDVQTLFKWFGIKDLATWNKMSLSEKRASHEKFAEHYEAYLFEGKSPNPEMQTTFQRFASWMKNVYKSLADFAASRNTQLTDEVRGVYDRMLATDEQIAQTEAMRNYAPLFKSAEQAGMTPEAWALYQLQGQESTETAVEELQARSLRDMRWTANARSRALKALTKDADEKRKAIEDEVKMEVASMPVYEAKAYLDAQYKPTAESKAAIAEHKAKREAARTQAMVDAKAALPGINDVTGLQKAQLVSKNKRELANSVDAAMIKWDRENPKPASEYTAADLQTASDMFGFTSPDEMLRAIADAEPYARVVEGMTDQRMLERYGDLASPAALEIAANKAVHNEARAKFVATELNALAKANKPTNVLLKAAKHFAEGMVATRKVRDLKPGQHTAAETRAARKANQAMAKGDTQAAILAKRDQLLQFYAGKMTAAAQDEVAKKVEAMKKIAASDKLPIEYRDQIEKLLERVDLKNRTLRELDKRAKLADWLKTQEEIGVEPDIPDYLLEDSQLTSYKDMTVEELRGLYDTIKQIEHLGRLKTKLLTARDQREFEAVRDDIAASIIAEAGTRKANPRTATTKGGRWLQAVKDFGSAHIKAATWVRVMDGGKDGGKVWEYFVRAANERGAWETTRRSEATEKLTAILEPWLKKGDMHKQTFFPTINRSLTRQEVLAMALNTGNESNLQRLLGGEGWTQSQVEPVLAILTRDEWAVVQRVWDHMESYWPEIEAKNMRVYGKRLAKVETGSSITEALGLRGGYYPVKYDPRASIRAEEHVDAEGAQRQLKGAYNAATTRRSFTKARADEVSGRPLLYNLSGLYNGVNDVIHDLAWHEWLIDTNRLLKSTTIDTAIRSHYGDAAARQLKTWRDAIAEGDAGSQEAMDSALGYLRQSVSVAGLGFNVMSAAMQPIGLTNSISRVGAKWIGKAVASYVASPLAMTKEAQEKSAFMANRSRTQFRDLNELRNRVQGEDTVMNSVRKNAYFLMMQAQRMVDVPTWHAAYERAISEGNDELRSRDLADQAVIDSQGGGETKDLSAIERGGSAQKLFTVFYSFMNTVANLGYASARTKSPMDKTMDILLLGVLPAMLPVLLKDALTPGDSGDDDWKKLARKLLGEQLGYLMGMMVVGREFAEAGKTLIGASDRPRDYAGPAGVRMIADTGTFAKQLVQGEMDDAFRKAAINLMGDLVGLPAAQLNRTITGTKALAEGKTNNPMAVLLGHQEPN
jgi:hypothetical protein